MLLLNRPHFLTAALACLGAGLIVLGGAPIYESMWSYARVFVPAPLGIWLWTVQSDRRWTGLLLAVGSLWTLTAAIEPWFK